MRRASRQPARDCLPPMRRGSCRAASADSALLQLSFRRRHQVFDPRIVDSGRLEHCQRGLAVAAIDERLRGLERIDGADLTQWRSRRDRAWSPPPVSPRPDPAPTDRPDRHCSKPVAAARGLTQELRRDSQDRRHAADHRLAIFKGERVPIFGQRRQIQQPNFIAAAESRFVLIILGYGICRSEG